MTCEQVRRQLTAYLDGELEARDGSSVRGHLRECAACRQVASDEGALRDGLRHLPPLDPPPSLWAGVQAQLAAAEVADARRPAWRRALARWAPAAPRFAAAGLIAAAAIATLWWRAHRASDDVTIAPPTKQVAVAPAPAPELLAPVTQPAASDDVTADLAGEHARSVSSYSKSADELLALATEARAQWSTEQQDTFDARVAELRGLVDRAPEGRAQERAWGELIKYVQRAAIRDDVTLAGGGL